MQNKKQKIRVTVKQQQAQEIAISTGYIRLDAFLKLCGAVMTGGHAKEAVQSGMVFVNGLCCEQRGKKLRVGDEVRFIRQRFVVVQNEGEKHDGFRTQHP